jgi:hypothetical protein
MFTSKAPLQLFTNICRLDRAMNHPETSHLTVKFKPNKQSNLCNTLNNQSAALSNGDKQVHINNPDDHWRCYLTLLLSNVN